MALEASQQTLEINQIQLNNFLNTKVKNPSSPTVYLKIPFPINSQIKDCIANRLFGFCLT